MSVLKYWIWLSHMAGQGSKTAVDLVRHEPAAAGGGSVFMEDDQ